MTLRAIGIEIINVTCRLGHGERPPVRERPVDSCTRRLGRNERISKDMPDTSESGGARKRRERIITQGKGSSRTGWRRKFRAKDREKAEKSPRANQSVRTDERSQSAAAHARVRHPQLAHSHDCPSSIQRPPLPFAVVASVRSAYTRQASATEPRTLPLGQTHLRAPDSWLGRTGPQVERPPKPVSRRPCRVAEAAAAILVGGARIDTRAEEPRTHAHATCAAVRSYITHTHTKRARTHARTHKTSSVVRPSVRRLDDDAAMR